MSYDADFANADPAGAPLDPIIMIGAEPVFWAAILLIILAALFFGWWLGARAGAKRADASEAIWKAVHEAARSAMGADDNGLKGAAETLRKVIEQRLGKTLKFAGGLSGRIKKLDEAIAGKGPAQPAGGGDGPVPPRAPGGEPRDHAESDGGRGANGGGAAAAAAASVTVVTIGGPTASTSTAPPVPPPPPRDLTQREQTDALRLAVAAFNEHWRDEATRVGELRAAHAELSDHGSAQK